MGLLTAPTPAFARPGKFAAGWPSGSRADVFSGCQSTSTTFADPSRLQNIEVDFEAAGRKITISYSGEVSRAKWVKQVLRSLVSRWGAEPGWDGYDAEPTNLDLVKALLNRLEIVMPENGSAPIITPLSDGGVQAEWHKRDSTLEIVAAANEPVRFYFYDASSETERSDVFDHSISLIAELIGLF